MYALASDPISRSLAAGYRHAVLRSLRQHRTDKNDNHTELDDLMERFGGATIFTYPGNLNNKYRLQP
jgi:hypothetical protein